MRSLRLKSRTAILEVRHTLKQIAAEAIKKATESAQTGGVTTTVASAVMRVAELDPSVDFYRDVVCCRVALSRTGDCASIDTGRVRSISTRPARLGGRGWPLSVSNTVMWATDRQTALERVTIRLRAHDPATYTCTEYGLTVVEDCDPDHSRVIVADPSLSRLPRKLIASVNSAAHEAGRRASPAMSCSVAATRPITSTPTGSGVLLRPVVTTGPAEVLALEPGECGDDEGLGSGVERGLQDRGEGG